MTLQELIDELSKIKDKSLPVEPDFIHYLEHDERKHLKVIVENYFCSPKQYVNISYDPLIN